MPNNQSYYSQNLIPVNITGEASWNNAVAGGFISINTDTSRNATAVPTPSSENNGIHPILAFKFIKKKFGIIEGQVMARRLEKLEKAAYQAIENGQEALSDKFLRELARETHESALYAKGIRFWVERTDVFKIKNQTREGHISDTRFEDYTKIIPKNVLEKKKKVEDVFDGFVVFHYYNEKTEKRLAKKQKISSEESAKMRDPILFGFIKETDRLYFIADWEDEFCDLTFDEIVDLVGENKLTKNPIIIT